MAKWKEPLKWDNAGSEPSEALKQEGFKAGYKPPADVFNYFLNITYQCLKELQGVQPYDIRAIDAMIGLVNGTTYTFDTALKQGEYNVQADNAAGAPYEGVLYGKLIVTLNDGKEKTDTNWIWQEFLPASASKQRCWRMKINTGAWTDWFVVYDTGHKPTLSELGAAAENHKHPLNINIGYDRTDIATNADLNDILDMGCYRCSTATKAATLKNCPTKNAFIMDMVASTGGNTAVNPASYSYGTQRIYVMGGREYVRQIISNGDGTITYGEWITMYSSLDKPTPAAIGAAEESTHKLKTYTNLSQLGLSDGATLSQVARALPSGSTIKIYVITSANAKLAPNATNGWFEAYRPSVNHVVFQFTTTSLKKYIANALNVGNSDEAITNWSKFVSQGEFDTHTHANITAVEETVNAYKVAVSDKGLYMVNTEYGCGVIYIDPTNTNLVETIIDAFPEDGELWKAIVWYRHGELNAQCICLNDPTREYSITINTITCIAKY